MKKTITFFVMMGLLAGCSTTDPSAQDGIIVYKTGFYRDLNFPGKYSSNCYFPAGFKMQDDDGSESSKILGVIDMAWFNPGMARSKRSISGNPHYVTTLIVSSVTTKGDATIFEGRYAWPKQKGWMWAGGCERVTGTFKITDEFPHGVIDFDLLFAGVIQLRCGNATCSSGKAKGCSGSKPDCPEGNPNKTTGRFSKVL